MFNRKGQTILEYTVILIIILGVLVAMRDYIKRGFQGRWKSAADQFGDQYDPNAINSSINYSTQTNGQSVITTESGVYAGVQGEWANQVDITNSVETKTGYTQVGS